MIPSWYFPAKPTGPRHRRIKGALPRICLVLLQKLIARSGSLCLLSEQPCPQPVCTRVVGAAICAYGATVSGTVSIYSCTFKTGISRSTSSNTCYLQWERLDKVWNYVTTQVSCNCWWSEGYCRWEAFRLRSKSWRSEQFMQCMEPHACTVTGGRFRSGSRCHHYRRSRLVQKRLRLIKHAQNTGPLQDFARASLANT
jgi:hypothetical protein